MDPDALGIEVRLGRVSSDPNDDSEVSWNRRPPHTTEGYFAVDSWKLATVQIRSRGVSVSNNGKILDDQELSSFVEDPESPTEADVLFTKKDQLPTFGGVLSTEEAFRLASLMTTRQLRIPLVLSFFASRATVLVHNDLRRLLTGILFEPSIFNAYPISDDMLPKVDDAAMDPFAVTTSLGPLGVVPLPPQNRHLLGTDEGLLHLELLSAPGPVLEPLTEILRQIKDRALMEDSDHQSPHFLSAVWAISCAARIEGYLRNAIATMQASELPASPLSASRSVGEATGRDATTALTALNQARKGLAAIRAILVGPKSFATVLSEALGGVDAVADVAAAAAIHGYTVLLRAHATDDELQLGYTNTQVDSPLQSASTDDPTSDSVKVIHDAANLVSTGYAELFSSMSFVSFYMRTIGSELSRLGVTWNKRAAPVVVGEGEAGQAANDLPRSVLLCVPWHDVFASVVRHRPGFISWLEGLELAQASTPSGGLLQSTALDVVLSHVLQVTMRHPRWELQKWQPEHGSAGKNSCVRWLESPHPYPNSTEVFTKIAFPGASSMTITFDPRSSTESKYQKPRDFVQLFHDESLTREWNRFSGSTGWPGVQNIPPLVIPSDSIVVRFKSDKSIKDRKSVV